MERVTSERIRTAEQHAQSLLRSLEQLKEGSIGSSLATDQSYGGSALSRKRKRERLPRKAKYNEKEGRSDADKNNSNTCKERYSKCACGNSAASRCNTNNCAKCCTGPSCGAKHHTKRQMNEKRKKTRNFGSDESSDSSDEDLPLANVRKKLSHEQRHKHTSNNSSESTDEEWTPYSLKKKKESKSKKGIPSGDSSKFSHLLPPTRHVTQTSGFPSSLRVPSVNSSMKSAISQPTTTHLNLPLLHLTRDHVLPRPWIPSEKRVSSLSVTVPNVYSQKVAALSHPTSTRIPVSSSSPSSSKQQSSYGIPTTYNPLSKSKLSSALQTEMSIHRLPYNQVSSSSSSSTDKRSTADKEKENKEDSILMFYVNYPYLQYCDQKRLVDLFRPYCGLSYIKWIDKRSAYVKISDDSTFHTYDTIYLNLVMKSDHENPNLIYVSPYNEYIKKQGSSDNVVTKTEKM